MINGDIMIVIDLDDFIKWLKSKEYSEYTIDKIVHKLTNLINIGVRIDTCDDEIKEMFWNSTKSIRHSYLYAWYTLTNYLIYRKIDYILDEFSKWLLEKGYSERTALTLTNAIKTLTKIFNSFCISEDEIINRYRYYRNKTRSNYLYANRMFLDFAKSNGNIVIKKVGDINEYFISRRRHFKRVL